MSETKTFENVIFKLRKDTAATWATSDLVLLNGEVGISYNSNPTSGFNGGVPTVGLKVGDGTHTFANLPWLTALAGDVYDWAKASTKPTYAANEITGLSTYIESNMTLWQIVSDNTNHTFTLQKKPAGASTWTDVSTITAANLGLGSAAYAATTDFDAAGAADAVLGASTDAAGTATVHGVKNLVGTIPGTSSATTLVGYVDEQIADAIGIDVTDTAVAGQLVSAVSQTDGEISVSRRALVAADIPDISTDKLTSGTLGVARGGTGASTLASGEALIGNGTGAVQTKAIDTTVTEDSANLVTSGAVHAAIEDVLDTISSAMNFIGVATVAITDGSTADPVISGYDFSNAASGDFILYSGLEFVWDGSKWVQLGDESSYALKTVAVSAGTGLTGGGNLTENRTISHAVPTGAGTSNNVVAANGKFINEITFDQFGHVTDVGTGDAESYTFAEGSTDGAFSVTPGSTGTAQSVPIHGLDDAAYRGVAAAIDATTNADKLPTASTVKSYVDGAVSGAIADLDSSVAATAASGNVYSVLTGVTQTDGELSGKTEVTLAAVAKTGNINDLIQTSGDILILDGGNASS